MVTTAARSRLGLIGWGRMGSRIGRRLLAADYEMSVYDPSPEAMEDAAASGAEPAADVTSALRGCSQVLTSLPDASAVKAAAYGPAGILSTLPAGAVWIEMSSSHPLVTRELARTVALQGAGLLDATLSGGVVGAESGGLTIMVGGPAELLKRVRPTLEVLSSRIIHVGGNAGDGDLAKVITNMLAGVNLTAIAEGLAVGVLGGLDLERLVMAIGSSSGASLASNVKIPRDVLTGTLNSGFKIRQQLKDLRTFLGLAAELQASARMGSLMDEMWRDLAVPDHEDDDHTAIVLLLARAAGIASMSIKDP